MAEFVFVANTVTLDQFEKITDIVTKSGGSITFIPEGQTHSGQLPAGTVSTSPMKGVTLPGPGNARGYTGVRLEFKDTGAPFAAEILRLFESRKDGASA